jgi:probable phosphoglycerate mutase
MLLVRHAQSAWNESGRWQGRADPPLSELGRRQAVSASSRLGAIDAIVTSPLERARDTAHAFAVATGVGPVVVDDDLVERDIGPWSGLTRAEIEDRWPGALDEGRLPAGFETDELLVQRSSVTLSRIGAMFDGATVVVVTHGGVIRSLERHHGHDGGMLANLAGRIVAHESGALVLGERIALLDDDELTVPAQL